MIRTQLLEVLRRETRSQHAALERTPAMVALLRDDVSLEDYRRVLAAMRALYAPLESGLLPALEKMQLNYGPLPYEYVARVPLIDRDLRAIDGDLETRRGTHRAAHPSPELPKAISAEQAIGVLYVLEGATRGGRIIAPHIHQVLGLDAGRGLDLFSLHRYHRSWEGYCRWLSDVQLSSVSVPVEAARLVFESLTLRLQALSDEVQYA